MPTTTTSLILTPGQHKACAKFLKRFFQNRAQVATINRADLKRENSHRLHLLTRSGYLNENLTGRFSVTTKAKEDFGV